MEIQTIVSMPFEENTYVVWLPGRADAVVFDPGLDPMSILEVLRDRGMRAAAILNTHGHADHIAGNAALKHVFPEAPLVIGAGDVAMLADPDANLSRPLAGVALVSPPADRTVKEGDVVEAAGMAFEVYEIPGHSPGHVVYVHRGEPCRVFGGDVLFRGGVGNCSFPGGSAAALFDGIRKKLFTLPPDTLVYPGHGPVTNVGHEMKTNPLLA
jgi:glyoxylase-like metal-dependent hydrolase (beta-lactamase superfamily II)